MSSIAVQHISPLSPPFETGDLTPVQVQVVAALAQGCSTLRAAAAVGIHRSTIHNWMRTSEEFRAAVDEARSHFNALIADQLNDLAATAIETLRTLLTSPDTPPGVRLKAALAVLERPGDSREPGWQLPQPVGHVIPFPQLGSPSAPIALPRRRLTPGPAPQPGPAHASC